MPSRRQRLVTFFLLTCGILSGVANAQPVTYRFEGEIDSVTRNDDDIIPGLSIGDLFSGFTTVESTGWNGEDGIIFVEINGVDLLFNGSSVFGGATAPPNGPYSIRIAADGSSNVETDLGLLAAGNFGPELIDLDGSAGITERLPKFFDLAEFEENIFRFGLGLVVEEEVPSDPIDPRPPARVVAPATFTRVQKSVQATGTLTSFVRVPEPSATGIALAALAIGCLNGSPLLRSSKPT